MPEWLIQLLSAVVGGVNDFGQGVSTAFANVGNEERFHQGLGELTDLRTRRQGDADAFADQQNQFASGLRSGTGNKFQDIIGRLFGLGDQERSDIDRDFGNLSSQTSAGLQSRGLTGTTLLPSMQRGVERERTSAQGRLSERLRREEIGVRTNALGADVNLGLRELLTRGQGEQFRVGTDIGLTNSIVNFLGQLNQNAPNEANHLINQGAIGSGGAPPPSFPSQSSSSGFWEGFVGSLAPAVTFGALS